MLGDGDSIGVHGSDFREVHGKEGCAIITTTGVGLTHPLSPWTSVPTDRPQGRQGLEKACTARGYCRIDWNRAQAAQQPMPSIKLGLAACVILSEDVRRNRASSLQVARIRCSMGVGEKSIAMDSVEQGRPVVQEVVAEVRRSPPMPPSAAARRFVTPL